MKVMVLGASAKPNRYSNMAINMLLNYEHEVIAIGNREGQVADVLITKVGDPPIDVDTITLYVGGQNQPPLYDYILNTNPRRVIFNPGTENPELYKMLEEKGIEVEVACTLVMLRINQF